VTSFEYFHTKFIYVPFITYCLPLQNAMLKVCLVLRLVLFGCSFNDVKGLHSLFIYRNVAQQWVTVTGIQLVMSGRGNFGHEL